VICHPPCSPHGKFRAVSRQDANAGYVALRFANRYGGVVEQPYWSHLFRGGENVAQGDYGRPAEKLTRLYWARGATR